jgi:tetratricopeptide (TPR) repeat protein
VAESASWPETIAVLEESLAIFRELGDLGGSAEVLDSLHLIAGYRGDTEHSRALIEASLRDSRLAGNPERLAWALANAADHAFSNGDDARRNALLDESLKLFAELKNTQGHGYVLLERAWAMQRQGDNRRTVAMFAEAVEVLREAGTTVFLGIALFCYGQALLRVGDHAQAVLLLQECLAVHAAVNGYEGDSLVLNTLGEAALAQGDHVAARARFRESQVFSRKMGDTWYSAAAQLGEGYVALDQGHAEAAMTCYTAALTIFASLPDWDDRLRRIGVAAVLAALASAAAQRAPKHTVRMYGAAAALRASVGRQFDSPFQLPSHRTSDEHVLASVRAALGDATFDVAWAADQTLTLEQAIAEALEIGASAIGS